MLSAIQPTNVPHLGNYLGAIKNWVDFQKDYQCFFFAVDLHSLTITQTAKERLQNLYKVIAYYLGAGLSPSDCIIFVQSHVSEHSELNWILNCHALLGELNRMTQFKDKSKKGSSSVNAGLLTYPVLMAADILLYNTDIVPVGHDQKQHLELARNLAQRVNSSIGKVFKIPEPMIQKTGARIMDLQSPESKMSKSASNQQGVIYLNDSNKVIQKKVRSAVTDSRSEVVPEQVSPGVHNLCQIHASLENTTIEDSLNKFSGQKYGVFKAAVSETIINYVEPVRKKADEFLEDPSQLDAIMKDGANKARKKAQIVLKKVRQKLGLSLV